MSIFYSRVFMHAAEIVAGKLVRWNNDGTFVRPYPGREWFRREFETHALHDAVVELLAANGVRPADWHQLLLEWPHRSVNDYNRVAYTENEAKGIADRQTVTTLGKYLTRHFPQLPSHAIRDIVARHTASGIMQIRYTMRDILHAVRTGPRSCMSHDIDVRCQDGTTRHPYEVYDPELGWGIAVRVDDGEVVGRALVWQDPDNADARCFVRTYKRGENYSYADEALCAWLKEQGYVHESAWPEGASMRYYPAGSSFLAPYIDGDTQTCTVHTKTGTFYVDSDGEHDCSQTGGLAGEQGEECEDCGHHQDEDDMYWVGPYEDRRVGPCCIDDYNYVYGRRGNQYYVHNENAIYVDSQDEWFDEDYLDDNNIVCLHNGEYEHTDNAVFIESEGEWYDSDDDDICYDDYNECYQLVRNCVNTEDEGLVHANDTWECNATGKHYSNNTEAVTIDGETYHPDDAPETTNETEGE